MIEKPNSKCFGMRLFSTFIEIREIGSKPRKGEGAGEGGGGGGGGRGV